MNLYPHCSSDGPFTNVLRTHRNPAADGPKSQTEISASTWCSPCCDGTDTLVNSLSALSQAIWSASQKPSGPSFASVNLTAPTGNKSGHLFTTTTHELQLYPSVRQPRGVRSCFHPAPMTVLCPLARCGPDAAFHGAQCTARCATGPFPRRYKSGNAPSAGVSPRSSIGWQPALGLSATGLTEPCKGGLDMAGKGGLLPPLCPARGRPPEVLLPLASNEEVGMPGYFGTAYQLNATRRNAEVRRAVYPTRYRLDGRLKSYPPRGPRPTPVAPLERQLSPAHATSCTLRPGRARQAPPGEWRYRCHGSLVVHVDGPRAGTWKDFEGDNGGGVLDFLEHFLGLDHARAFAWLAGSLSPQSSHRTIHRPRPAADARNRVNLVRALWAASVPIPTSPDHPARRWLFRRKLW